MYVFTNLLFEFMTVFIDALSTQSSASSHLECVKETLVRCMKMRLALNLNKTFLGVHKDSFRVCDEQENEKTGS